MTISNQESFVVADGNGVTTQFSYSFLIPTAADVVVTITDTSVDPPVDTVLITTQYTITGLGSSSGGLVTFPLSGPALSSDFTITISRALAIVQNTAISNQGNFYPASVEGALDYLTMVCQDIEGEVDQINTTIGALSRADITVASSFTNTVATVAALKAATVSIASVGGVVILGGYYAANDGGEGLFYITNVNPGADNGGTIIWSNTSGFYYVRQYSGDINVRWFGAKGDHATDDIAAFTAALAAGDSVFAPDGNYVLSTSLTISGGKKLTLSVEAALIRLVSASATTPVVYVLGIRSELVGGQVLSAKASPDGIVCLGHMNNSDGTTGNAYWWRFRNCTVQGLNTAGNIAINVPSAQATLGASFANFFGCIENINIFGADLGILFREYANAHNTANIQYWDCRTACLELRGAYANNIVNQFMHTGAANGLIGIKVSNKTVGGQESSLNTVTGFTVETGGAADVAVSISTNATKNTIIGNDNVAGGFTLGNTDNLLILSGIVRACTDMQMQSAEFYTSVLIHNTRSGTRPSRDENNNTINALAANATLTLKNTVLSGLLIIRNASDGITATVMADSVAGATLINGGGFAVVGADPGAASSKFWVVSDTTSTRITNRYAVAKHVDVRTVGAST
jgi:hypothetical protein